MVLARGSRRSALNCDDLSLTPKLSVICSQVQRTTMLFALLEDLGPLFYQTPSPNPPSSGVLVCLEPGPGSRAYRGGFTCTSSVKRISPTSHDYHVTMKRSEFGFCELKLPKSSHYLLAFAALILWAGVLMPVLNPKP